MFALSALVFVGSGVMLIRGELAGRKNAQTYSEVAQLVVRPDPADRAGWQLPKTDSAPETESQTQQETAEPEQAIEEDLLSAYETYAAVAEKNSDFLGWLQIPGTSIDYPVMQMDNQTPVEDPEEDPAPSDAQPGQEPSAQEDNAPSEPSDAQSGEDAQTHPGQEPGSGNEQEGDNESGDNAGDGDKLLGGPAKEPNADSGKKTISRRDCPHPERIPMFPSRISLSPE